MRLGRAGLILRGDALPRSGQMHHSALESKRVVQLREATPSAQVSTLVRMASFS